MTSSPTSDRRSMPRDNQYWRETMPDLAECLGGASRDPVPSPRSSLLSFLNSEQNVASSGRDDVQEQLEPSSRGVANGEFEGDSGADAQQAEPAPPARPRAVGKSIRLSLSSDWLASSEVPRARTAKPGRRTASSAPVHLEAGGWCPTESGVLLGGAIRGAGYRIHPVVRFQGRAPAGAAGCHPPHCVAVGGVASRSAPSVATPRWTSTRKRTS